MLTARLRELLDHAILGDIEAYQTFQSEKLNQFTHDERQTKERLSYFETLHHQTVVYFLQQPDISSCSSKLLYFIINAFQNEKYKGDQQVFNTLLERAIIKCTDHPALCNVSGIHMASLYFNSFIKKEIKRPAYRQSLLLLADDVEGMISFLQAAELELCQKPDILSQDRILTKFKLSADKKNELACSRLVSLLSKDQDLSVLDKENDSHKQIMRNLKRATAHGYGAACYQLAEILLVQKNDDVDAVAENRQQAIAYLMRGIDARSPACMYRLATLYFQIHAQNEDKIREAILLIKYAATEFHYAEAELLLAKMEKKDREKTIIESKKHTVTESRRQKRVRFTDAQKAPRLVAANGVHAETTTNVILGLSNAFNPVSPLSTQVASTVDYRRDEAVSHNPLFDNEDQVPSNVYNSQLIFDDEDWPSLQTNNDQLNTKPSLSGFSDGLEVIDDDLQYFDDDRLSRGLRCFQYD